MSKRGDDSNTGVKTSGSAKSLQAAIGLVNAQKPSLQEVLKVLGDPPWGEEVLRDMLFRNVEATNEALRRLPGYRIHEAIGQLKEGIKLFNESADYLYAQIDGLEMHLKRRKHGYLGDREEEKRQKEDISRGLYYFMSAAFSVVEGGRRVRDRLCKAGVDISSKYNDQRRTIFVKHEHKFVMQLRHTVTHVQVPGTGSSHTVGGNEERASVFFDAEALDDHDWNAGAKAYVALHKRVVFKDLILSYQPKVNAFAKWLIKKVKREFEGKISDYIRCKSIIKKYGNRTSYKIFNQLAKPGITDPYDHLDRFLTDDQIERVMRLPMRSKEQVDEIVFLADDCEAVDDELRNALYELFAKAP